MLPGDSVFAKLPRYNKLFLPFNPQPYKLIQTKGSTMTTKCNNHRITQNSFFKQVQAEFITLKGLVGMPVDDRPMPVETSSGRDETDSI